jgi:hypothetical protein
MNEVGQYRRREKVVEAIQLPCDPEVLEAWLGGSDVYLGAYDFDVEANARYLLRIIPDQHWIVKDKDKFRVVDNATFEWRYEMNECPQCGNIGCAGSFGGLCWTEEK